MMNPSSTDAADIVRAALQHVVSDYGRRVTENPPRLRAMLNDVLGAAAGDSRAAVDALVVAAQEGVAAGLLGPVAEPSRDAALLERLTDWGLEPAMATWAISTWATVLGAVASLPPASLPPTAAPVAAVLPAVPGPTALPPTALPPTDLPPTDLPPTELPGLPPRPVSGGRPVRPARGTSSSAGSLRRTVRVAAAVDAVLAIGGLAYGLSRGEDTVIANSKPAAEIVTSSSSTPTAAPSVAPTRPTSPKPVPSPSAAAAVPATSPAAQPPPRSVPIDPAPRPDPAPKPAPKPAPAPVPDAPATAEQPAPAPKPVPSKSPPPPAPRAEPPAPPAPPPPPPAPAAPTASDSGVDYTPEACGEGWCRATIAPRASGTWDKLVVMPAQPAHANAFANGDSISWDPHHNGYETFTIRWYVQNTSTGKSSNVATVSVTMRCNTKYVCFS